MIAPTVPKAEPIVQVRGLSKEFKVYGGPLDLIKEHLLKRPRHAVFKALDDLSFNVRPGQVLGVVGPNGAGKSTLLRILAGTLDKTSGQVVISGKVASILELGTGFHPDFTGRENVLLAGLCHGMSASEVRSKIPWIEEFSGLGGFFDKPVRTYSSGMQARLFFSAAAAADSDILLVDEALSVGDARFQRKCFALMERFRDRGGAVILVSHDINMIVGFCDRALLLENGRMLRQGSSRDISQHYFRRVLSNEDTRVDGTVGAQGGADSSGPAQTERYGDGRATIVDFGLLDAEGRSASAITTGEECTLFSRAMLNRDLESTHFGFEIKTVTGVIVFRFNTLRHERLGALPKGALLEARFELRMWLAPGEYFITFGIWPPGGPHYDRLPDALAIRVMGDEYLSSSCIVNLQPRLSLVRVEDGAHRVENHIEEQPRK